MEHRLSRLALWHLVTLCLGAIVAAAAAYTARTATGLASAALVGCGAWVAGLTWCLAVLRTQEARERQDMADLEQRSTEASLFATNAEALRARRSRLFFERWILPGATVLLGIIQGGVSYLLLRRLPTLAPWREDQAMMALAFFGLLALVFFLVGKYAAGMARHLPYRPLRPNASYLLLGALLFAVTVAMEAVAWLGYPRLDRYAAQALAALLALVCLETALNLLLELYRPRQRAGETRVLYESRVLGLLSQPGGLISTAAQAMDYQFGFKVSETWFYRWLEQALGWLLLLQAAILWATSTLVIVEPHQVALIERFGRHVAARGQLPPGIHLKWPWPIEAAEVVGLREARSLHVGFVPDPALEAESTLLWTKPHYKEEFNLLVASREASTEDGDAAVEVSVPVNLLTASIPVQYQITNALDWVYRHADPASLLERLATREVAHYLVTVDMDDIMAGGRAPAATELRQRIQDEAQTHRLGVEILFVGLQDIHPPVQVADAYEAVIGATQERETKVLDAQAYHAERLPLARAESDRKRREAEGARAEQTARATGRAGMFTNQLAAFTASPTVYRQRALLDTIVRAVRPARKYVLTVTNAQEDYWINLEDKLRPDLLDVPVPAVAPKKP